MKQTFDNWKTRKIKIGDSVRCISYDDSSKFAYMGCEDGRIKIFNIKAEKVENIINAHNDCIRHIDLYKQWIITSSNDKSIKIFSKSNNTLVATLLGHTNSVPTFTTFKLFNQKSIISFILCLKYKYQNGMNGFCKSNYPVPKVIVRKISEFSKIDYLASGSYDNTIKIWNLEDFCCLQSWVAHNGIIRALYSIDNKYLVSGSYDKKIKVWDIEKLVNTNDHENSLIHALELHKGPIFCFARHKNLFFSGSKDKRIVIYEIAQDFRVFQVIKKAHNSWVWSINVLSSKTFYTTSADKTIKIWKRKKKKLTQKFSSVDSLCSHKDQVFCIAPLNKTKFITGSFDKTLRVWKKLGKNQKKKVLLKK
eukprot:TRINITY_DN5106_c0_g1_i1.p1 TRINITY_DN5106_c0_g1~~TRINITY_DN5106_c0_g1_i1.p1  ORF type:complete len:364 (+),score=38.02 TRINITY_DN5106_c0_g1_i1:37-1128(+)